MTLFNGRLKTVVRAGSLIGGALLSSWSAWPAGGAGSGQAAASNTPPIDESQRVELRGQVHRAVRDSQDLGDADPHQSANRIIMLLHGSAQQDAELVEFLRNVQTPGRPEYHRWLTPDAFGRRFGAHPADLAILRAWLQSKGFRIEEAPAGGRTLILGGTLGQLNDAFQTHMHRYLWRSERHLANSTTPSIPRALAGVIAGFASLDDFRHRPQYARPRPRPQFTAGPSSHYLAPGDFATIYDLIGPYAQGLTGMGRTIAVIGRSSVQTDDLINFRSSFGLSSVLPTTIYANSGNQAPPEVAGDELESDLDLEWSGAVAPSAKIEFVTTASTELSDGVDLSAQWAVSNNLADIITLSYGGCESTADLSGGTTLYQQLWQQAAAQGTSVFVSSGDSGAAGCDADSSSSATHGTGVNVLCSSPDSTCVGGTEFTADVSSPAGYWSSVNASGTQASALSYIPEAVWNQSGTVTGGSDLYASGGGASIYFAKPAWQLAFGVPSDGRRDVPDIALNASSAHDGYLVFSSDGFQTSTLMSIGGTSASTPSMAGIAALIAQSQGGRVGNVNPILYGLSALQVNGGAQVFHAVTSGNNSVPGQTGFSASTGDPIYNQASGLGSVDGAQLISHWGNYVPPPYGLSPAIVVVPASATVGGATLRLPPSTSWSATVGGSASSWIDVSPVSGTGSAQLTYGIAANPGTSARSGTVTVDGQVLTVTQSAATASSGNAAVAQLSSSALGFGADPIGQSTAAQDLLVSNTGNASLTLGSISLSGGASGDFSASGTCIAGLALVPGASCFLNISFDATATGPRAASLQINVSGGGSKSVNLSGTGETQDSAGSDGPLPLWAYGCLAALMTVIARRARPMP